MKNFTEKIRFVSKITASALVAGLLALVPIPSANAHGDVGATNVAASAAAVDQSLIVATELAQQAVLHPSTAVATTGHAARSAGLLAKSTSMLDGQTATVRAGGVLSLYAQVSTSAALTASGGSFVKSNVSFATSSVATTTPAIGVAYTMALAQAGTATPIAALWQAPTTTGDYTVTLRVSTATSQITGATTGSNGSAAVVMTVTVTDAHDVVGGSNVQLTMSGPDSSLYTAVTNSTTGASIVSSATDVGSAHVTARSLGLLSKDSTVGTAQTATILAGGALSLYAVVATDVAFNATGGTFSGAVANLGTVAYNQTVRSVFIDVSAGANLVSTAGSATTTSVAVRWTAPTTPGTYTVSMDRSASTTQLASDDFSGTLTGSITVTVVAASAGGSYSAAYSLCNTRSNSQGHGVATGVDTTSAITNSQTAYIAFDLDDAYDQSLDAGALVVSATGGALISLASNGSTAAAGTTSTVVSTVAPTNQVVQVVQGTANAPMTTTVTITFGGTTVCTKTITIRGEIAKLEIANIGVGDINSANSITAGASTWIANTLGDVARAGLFTVVGRDSAGNAVVTNSGGSFAVDSATLTTTVQALSVPETATNVSSSSAAFGIYGVGTWTCGATAGSSNMKLKWTNSGSGTVVTSDAFTARCADDPYTYTASWDKASYVAGEIATLTVQFLDSKGNKANNVGAHGGATITAPMFTAVTAHTGTVSNKADGSRVYTFTVGKDTGITAGTYTSIVEYASLVAGTKQTPTYKVGTGTSEVTNAEVLKSIVALIASINKQIQALQKLLLKR
jgi:hypothetical protein